jgi:AAA15 family ATPase/GTPase
VLIRFEVSNFRSIDEPVELSMVAVDRDRPEVRPQPHLGESLLTTAAIFGPNASGKSNVLTALAWLRDALKFSFRFWEDEIPLEQFAFGSGSRTTDFTLELTVDGIRFEYHLDMDSERIHYEALFHYPEKKRRRVYERVDNDLKLQRGLGSISGTREILTGKTLVLAAALRFDEPLLTRFAEEILAIRSFGIPVRQSRYPGVRWAARPRDQSALATMRWFADSNQPTLFTGPNDVADRQQALALLRLADLGIEDVLIEERELVNPDNGEIRRDQTLSLVHRSSGRPASLDFSAESEGTKTWFQLIGPILDALRAGSIVVFDELDASLHPTLSAELLKIFQDPAINPLGAQLVFSSHDASLLGHLNRDEVWLTEKLDDGSTRLGALADFAGERVRKSQNLETAYLHGRFGALPQIDSSGLLRALGLIG